METHSLLHVYEFYFIILFILKYSFLLMVANFAVALRTLPPGVSYAVLQAVQRWMLVYAAQLLMAPVGPWSASASQPSLTATRRRFPAVISSAARRIVLFTVSSLPPLL